MPVLVYTVDTLPREVPNASQTIFLVRAIRTETKTQLDHPDPLKDQVRQI